MPIGAKYIVDDTMALKKHIKHQFSFKEFVSVTQRSKTDSRSTTFYFSVGLSRRIDALGWKYAEIRYDEKKKIIEFHMNEECMSNMYHLFWNKKTGLVIQSIIAFYLSIPHERYIPEVDEEKKIIRFYWSDRRGK